MKKLITLLSLIFVFILGCISSSQSSFSLQQKQNEQIFQNEKSVIETIFENFDNVNFQNYDLNSERHLLIQTSNRSQSQLASNNNEYGLNPFRNTDLNNHLKSKHIKYSNNRTLHHEKYFENQTKPRAP